MRVITITSLTFLFVIKLAFTPVLAYDGVEDLDLLIANGHLKLDISAKGGHSEGCLRLIAQNIGQNYFVTQIEPGRFVVADSSELQDLLITQEIIIALAPKQVIEKEVYAFCMQSQDESPGAGNTYSMGPKADAYLVQLAKYLNNNRDISPSEQQHAVWTLSDCHPLSSIHQLDQESAALASFVSDLLGIPKPWYTTDHVKTVNALFNPQVERLFGEMSFAVTDYTQITVLILDEQEKVVKRLLNQSHYGPGKYSFPVDLHVKNWWSGNYEIRFINERQQIFKSYAFEI